MADTKQQKKLGFWKWAVSVVPIFLAIWLSFFADIWPIGSINVRWFRWVASLSSALLDAFGISHVMNADLASVTSGDVPISKLTRLVCGPWLPIGISLALVLLRGKAWEFRWPRVLIVPLVAVALPFSAALTLALVIAISTQWQLSDSSLTWLVASIWVVLCGALYVGAECLAAFFQKLVFRERRWFLFGAIIPICVLGLLVLYVLPEPRIDTLKTRAKQALENGEDRRAEIYFKRFHQLAPEDGAGLIGLGKLYEKQGDLQRAFLTMQEAAQTSEFGTFEAHYWIAEKLSRRVPTTAEENEVLLTHLSALLEVEPSNVQMLEWLAQCHFHAQRWLPASLAYQQIVDQRPKLRLKYCKVLRKLNREKELLKQLNLAYDEFLGRENLEQDIEALGIAINCILLKIALNRNEEFDTHREFGKALAILEKADQGDPVVQSLVLLVRSSKIEYEITQDEVDAKFVFQEIQALYENPLATRAAIAHLSVLFEKHPKHRQTIIQKLAALRESEADPAQAGLLAKVLGDMAATVEAFDKALEFYEAAEEALPNDLVLANNFSYVLLQVSPPQPERALEISNRAKLLLTSGNPNIVGEYQLTRGQILAELGQWVEACNALADGLAVFPNRASIHEALIRAYRARGMEELAIAQENRLQEIRKQANPE